MGAKVPLKYAIGGRAITEGKITQTPSKRHKLVFYSRTRAHRVVQLCVACGVIDSTTFFRRYTEGELKSNHRQTRIWYGEVEGPPPSHRCCVLLKNTQ